MNLHCFEMQMKFKILLLIELKNATFVFSDNIGIELLVCRERNDTKLTILKFKLHIVPWGGYG